jgi:hypothetical protein
MTRKLVLAELKIRLNATFLYADMYRYILSNQELLKAIRLDENIRLKKSCSVNLFICFSVFP